MTIKEIIAQIDKTKISLAHFISVCKTEDYVGNYHNWNYKDVIAHILEWLIFSKNKLYAIANKLTFSETDDIDTFNKHNYEKNKEKHIEELQNGIMRELDAYKKVVPLYSQSDLQRKDLPTGFSFELWRYMIMDTVIHPVMHILYHSLKTKKYELFCRLCENHSETFFRYADGKPDVYVFDEYIENRKEFIIGMKELASQYCKNKLMGISKNSVGFLEMPGDFKFKSLYYNELNLNIANYIQEKPVSGLPLKTQVFRGALIHSILKANRIE